MRHNYLSQDCNTKAIQRIELYIPQKDCEITEGEDTIRLNLFLSDEIASQMSTGKNQYPEEYLVLKDAVIAAIKASNDLWKCTGKNGEPNITIHDGHYNENLERNPDDMEYYHKLGHVLMNNGSGRYHLHIEINQASKEVLRDFLSDVSQIKYKCTNLFDEKHIDDLMNKIPDNSMLLDSVGQHHTVPAPSFAQHEVDLNSEPNKIAHALETRKRNYRYFTDLCEQNPGKNGKFPIAEMNHPQPTTDYLRRLEGRASEASDGLPSL